MQAKPNITRHIEAANIRPVHIVKSIYACVTQSSSASHRLFVKMSRSLTTKNYSFFIVSLQIDGPNFIVISDGDPERNIESQI